MMKTIIKSSIISIALAISLYAQENVQQIIDKDQTALSSADADANIPTQSFEEWSSEFLQKAGYELGVTKNGKTFYASSVPVTVKPIDPAYGKELQLAYDKAFLKLQSDFIMQTYGKIVSETLMDTFSDDSTNAKEFPPQKVEESIKKGEFATLLDKALKIADNKLNEILKSQGVEESKLNTMTTTQKKELFKDNLSKKSMKKAYQSIAGLVVVKTTIIKGSSNNDIKVGIIAVMSDKTLQFAKDMSKKRETLVRGKGKALKDVLPANDKGYLDELGIRFLYDENGKPMLLSYGRWSVVNLSTNASSNARKIDIAKSKAMTIAQSAISQFQGTQILVQEETESQSISKELAVKVSTYNKDEVVGEDERVDTITETIDKYFKKSSAKTSMQLRGTSQVRTWEAKDENGILHVGSVVIWSYDTLDNANKIANQQEEKKEKPKVANEEKKEIKIINKESKLINSMEDF